MSPFVVESRGGAASGSARSGAPSGGLILLYHRVASPLTDPQLLCVSPQRFADQLAMLRSQCKPMSLARMVDLSRRDQLPERAVAITFDDGYADNLLAARPLLAQEGIPATVFIATGYLDGRREFWWDALERIVLVQHELPSQLEIEVEGERRSWAVAAYDDGDDGVSNRGKSWTVLDDPVPRHPFAGEPWSRHALYLDLFNRLVPLSEASREQVMEALSHWSGVPRDPRESHRPMTADEVPDLAADGLVEVGAHTVSHARLSAHAESVQRDELLGSRQRLEALLASPVTSFSYPFGTRRDYSATSVRLAREAGFDRAVSNFRGRVTRQSDPFQLPRVLVRDWDADGFALRLEQEWACARP